MSYANVGKVWSLENFDAYLNSIEKPSWCKGVCLHHTAAPSLAMRPQGFLSQHIRNIEAFYKGKKWSAGPHFFTDENEIFGMTPPNIKGVHAVSFNRSTIGIEDYDTELNDKGRGLDCWKTTAAATAMLLNWLDLEPNYNTVLFHRDDPKTSKSCPGRRVQKPWVLNLIREFNTKTLDVKPAHNPVDDMHFVEVAEYLQDVKNYSSRDISQMLKKDEDNLFYFGDEWLENAYYDANKKATVAPIKELCDIPRKK